MAVWTCNYSIRDAKGQNSQHKIYLPLLVPQFIDPQADPAEFAAEYALALDPLLTGFIVGINLSLSLDLPAGLNTFPADNSDVEEGAKFTYRTVGGFTFEHRIPTFREDLLEDDGAVDQVEMAAASPDYNMLMTNATELPADWAFRVTDSRGDNLSILTAAREKFNASRRF